MLQRPCKDCGQVDGMGWWVGRYAHPGSASRRCYECYLAYQRERTRRKAEREGRSYKPTGRHTGRSKVKRVPVKMTGSVGSCVVCGAEFTRGAHQTSLQVCSPTCRKQTVAAINRRKNAKRRGAKTGGRFTLADVVSRDGNKCHLCGKRVNLSLPGTDPRGPTVDHLLPIAAGGLDELANVRLAHRSCNCARGTSGDVQLLLFG